MHCFHSIGSKFFFVAAAMEERVVKSVHTTINVHESAYHRGGALKLRIEHIYNDLMAMATCSEGVKLVVEKLNRDGKVKTAEEMGRHIDVQELTFCTISDANCCLLLDIVGVTAKLINIVFTLA